MLDEIQMTWIPLRPKLPNSEKARNYFVRTLQRLATIDDRTQVAAIRAEALQDIGSNGGHSPELRVCISVMCDLRIQGWAFKLEGASLWASPPRANATSPLLEKQRIREAHLFERNSQLRVPAVREFIRSMERRRLGPRGWTSILSLMRDGPELSSKLQGVIRSGDYLTDPETLRRYIDPYIQVVDADSRCQFTGFKLRDVWRYFRHTWVIPYYSVPGRQIWILIRDAAAENHPVIGIAALGSAVVQLTPRDKWIGWTPQSFLEKLAQNPTSRWAQWVWQSRRELLGGIYVKDFLEEDIISRSDIKNPSPKAIGKLLNEAKRARQWHTRFPKASQHKKVEQDWDAEARTYLFRAKRALAVAELLTAKVDLLQAGFKSPTKDGLAAALKTGVGRHAIEVVLRHMKAKHVGIDMLDIMVCGAIAPYNPLLGGKLVALLMTSPEVALAYERRYATSSSIIASSMAGRPILRKPQLVLLGTTSLYGVASSQYNRLKLPAEQVGGNPGAYVSYELLGHSLGYGSNHLSPTTVNEIEILLARSEGGRKVNSIFGEGVNPRLRKIRDGLSLAGLPSDKLLMHGNSRIVYGVRLASNFRSIVLGCAKRANYILPRSDPKQVTRRIADFWLRRWLSKRIEREDVLREVERHSLDYPLGHGARVVLPPCDDEEPLFSLAR